MNDRFTIDLRPTITGECRAYLGLKGLHVSAIGDYIQQAQITERLTKKKRIGLAFENNSNGYEFVIPKTGFYGHSGKKDITYLPSKEDYTDTIYAFNHFEDFLHRIENFDRQKDCGYLVINGCMDKAIADIIAIHPPKLYHVCNDERLAHIMAELMEPTEIEYGQMDVKPKTPPGCPEGV